jgi:hypothetical protein
MQQGAHDMTHPIIARLYMDRQRQQSRLVNASDALEEAISSLYPLTPSRAHYATEEGYNAALRQVEDWHQRLEAVVKEIDATSIEIHQSLSAPDSHLKGYPR